MNYDAHYERLVSHARERRVDCYVERHHVLPRCMGGGNEAHNIVSLTAEEHYVAHQLLVKIHPEVPGLIWAALRLSRVSGSNKSYGWLRRLNAIARANAMRGTSPSQETRAKLSAAIRGQKLPPRTQQQIARHAAAIRGKKRPPRSPEWCFRLSAALVGNRNNVGRQLSEESKKKISESQIGKVMSLESRAKMLGNKNAVGSKRSPETREKMRVGRLKYLASRRTAIESETTPEELKTVIPEAFKA